MNDLIRSGIYTGLGSLVLARKKFREFAEELIQNNQLTQDEGRRVMHELIHRAEDLRNGTERKFLNILDDLLLRTPLPARNEMEVKLQELIDQLNQFRKKSLFSSSGGPSTTKPAANP